jgi:hypothetical protein
MSIEHRWSIRSESDFQRVLLDTMYKGPWSDHIKNSPRQDMTNIELHYCCQIMATWFITPSQFVDDYKASLKLRKVKC